MSPWAAGTGHKSFILTTPGCDNNLELGEGEIFPTSDCITHISI